jgi:hypothetical protein
VRPDRGSLVHTIPVNEGDMRVDSLETCFQREEDRVELAKKNDQRAKRLQRKNQALERRMDKIAKEREKILEELALYAKPPAADSIRVYAPTAPEVLAAFSQEPSSDGDADGPIGPEWSKFMNNQIGLTAHQRNAIEKLSHSLPVEKFWGEFRRIAGEVYGNVCRGRWEGLKKTASSEDDKLVADREWAKFIKNKRGLSNYQRGQIEILSRETLHTERFWHNFSEIVGDVEATISREQWEKQIKDLNWTEETPAPRRSPRTRTPKTKFGEEPQKRKEPETVVIDVEPEKPKSKRQRCKEDEDEYSGSEYPDDDEDEFEDWADPKADVEVPVEESDSDSSDSFSMGLDDSDDDSPPLRKTPKAPRFEDGGPEAAAEVITVAPKIGAQFDSLREDFEGVLDKTITTWRTDFEHFFHIWTTNPFFKRAEYLLLIAWKRGFEGEGQPNTKTSFHQLLEDNFAPDAPDTKFEKDRPLGEGLCEACGSTKQLSCKFWPNYLENGHYHRYGGNCARNMENVDTFMHWLKTMLREIRKNNKTTAVSTAKKNQYWGDLITPLDSIQTNL